MIPRLISLPTGALLPLPRAIVVGAGFLDGVGAQGEVRVCPAPPAPLFKWVPVHLFMLFMQ